MEKLNSKPARLLSLDVLRGFDMLFIMGGAAIFVALNQLFPCAPLESIAEQMHHVKWDGIHHHDTIFPLFLFIAGISFPFSLEKQRAAGKSQRDINLKIIRRGITLVILGIIYNGLLNWDFATLRYASVLGRIGIAWMISALMYVYFNTSLRVAIAVAILVGYWLLVAFVPAPDAPDAGVFTMEGSIVGYIDRNYLPGRLHKVIHDPEGLLSTIPAIVSAMLGVFTGQFIKLKNECLTDTRKVVIMFAAAIILLAVGMLWSTIFPINKNLWTSSFVCVVGAYCVFMFALFFYIIDVKNYRRWTTFFTVIGLNSITIYLAQKFINFSYTADRLFGGTINLLPECAQPLATAIAYTLLCWLLLYALYRLRIFLKI